MWTREVPWARLSVRGIWPGSVLSPSEGHVNQWPMVSKPKPKGQLGLPPPPDFTGLVSDFLRPQLMGQVNFVAVSAVLAHLLGCLFWEQGPVGLIEQEIGGEGASAPPRSVLGQSLASAKPC